MGVGVFVLFYLLFRVVCIIFFLLNWVNVFFIGVMLEVNGDNVGLVCVVGLVSYGDFYWVGFWRIGESDMYGGRDINELYFR